MSGLTDRVRSESTNWSFHTREPGTGAVLVWAMLEVIDAAETLINPSINERLRGYGVRAADLDVALARFREVAS